MWALEGASWELGVIDRRRVVPCKASRSSVVGGGELAEQEWEDCDPRMLFP